MSSFKTTEEIIKFIKENKIKKSSESNLNVNYKQLKAIYDFFELKNHDYASPNGIHTFISILNDNHFTKNQIKYEFESWIMNIQHIYELINSNFFFKPKFNFYFEYHIETSRIDILIKKRNKSLIIECSHGYNEELLQQKQNQLNKYLKLYSKPKTIGVVYISDENSKNKTIKETIKALKKL